MNSKFLLVLVAVLFLSMPVYAISLKDFYISVNVLEPEKATVIETWKVEYLSNLELSTLKKSILESSTDIKALEKINPDLKPHIYLNEDKIRNFTISFNETDAMIRTEYTITDAILIKYLDYEDQIIWRFNENLFRQFVVNGVLNIPKDSQLSITLYDPLMIGDVVPTANISGRTILWSSFSSNELRVLAVEKRPPEPTFVVSNLFSKDYLNKSYFIVLFIILIIALILLIFRNKVNSSIKKVITKYSVIKPRKQINEIVDFDFVSKKNKWKHMSLKFQESDSIVYEYIKSRSKANLEEILKDINYNVDSIRRSLETLKINGIIEENTTSTFTYELDINGKLALENGFIEEIFCNYIQKNKTKVSVINTLNIPNLTREDTTLAFGIAKRKDLIEIINDEIKVKENYLEQITKQKNLLSSISLKKPIIENQELQELLKRKEFIIKKEKQNKEYKLLQIIAYELIADQQLYLTPELLKSGEYKNIDFKEFEVSILPNPKEQGRINPLRQVIYQIRELFLEMGFKEMQGPYIETCFWNMDAMFISQNHPARDIQDTFYLDYFGELPTERNITSQIAEIHNNGWKTGSKGYQYDWCQEESKKLILRTHTTATTYRTFFHLTQEEKENSKYFCIDKVFRNETIDYTHLPEFHQAEGFIIGDNLSLADLLAFIKEFFLRLGIKKVKFKPTYNPYTEPSVEASGYHEGTGKWIELINAGIFRPESLAPYGIEKTVIAWGLGVERLAMLLYQKSIKEIHGDEENIDWLKEYILPKRKL